jgi:hypothetical protein
MNQPSAFIMSAEGRVFVYVVARAFLFFARSDLQLDEEIASPPKYNGGGSQ